MLISILLRITKAILNVLLYKFIFYGRDVKNRTKFNEENKVF